MRWFSLKFYRQTKRFCNVDGFSVGNYLGTNWVLNTHDILKKREFFSEWLIKMQNWNAIFMIKTDSLTVVVIPIYVVHYCSFLALKWSESLLDILHQWNTYFIQIFIEFLLSIKLCNRSKKSFFVIISPISKAFKSFMFITLNPNSVKNFIERSLFKIKLIDFKNFKSNSRQIGWKYSDLYPSMFFIRLT